MSQPETEREATMSNEIGSMFGELEKAFSGPALAQVMKILTPQQMGKAIAIAGARKRGDMTMVEKGGREFLATLTGAQMTALERVVPASVASKLSELARQ